MRGSKDGSEPSAAPKQPADLARLRIARGDESVGRIRGFPWIKVCIALGLVALLFLFRQPLLSMFGGGGGLTVRTGRAVKVIPGQAQAGDVAANGYIVADTQASLASVISGRLVELNAAEGDIVEVDQVVARIQHDDLEVLEKQAAARRGAAAAGVEEARSRTASAKARVIEAQKDVEAARLTSTRLDAEKAAQEKVVAEAEENADRLARDVERNRKLFEDKLIDAGTWDRIQTEARASNRALEAARARERATAAALAAWAGQIARREAALTVADSNVQAAAMTEAVAAATLVDAQEAEKLAGIQLEKTRIRAPFRGLVIRKDAEKGEVIAPTGAGNSRGSVLTIVDPESLEVQVELSERRIGSVNEGDRAVVFLDADPDTGMPGTVRKIWPRADRSKGSIEVRVRLTQRPASLRPEMAARVVFKGGERVEEAGEAYVTVPQQALARRGGKPVVFVVEGGVAVMRVVDPGAVQGQRTRIHAGLDGGEVVILEPPLDLEAGRRVVEE